MNICTCMPNQHMCLNTAIYIHEQQLNILTFLKLLQEISTQAYYSLSILSSCYWSLLLSKFQQFICDSVTPALTSYTLVPYFQTSTKQNTTNSWKCTQNRIYSFPYDQRPCSSVTTLRNAHYCFRLFFTSQSWSITPVISPLTLSARVTVFPLCSTATRPSLGFQHLPPRCTRKLT